MYKLRVVSIVILIGGCDVNLGKMNEFFTGTRTNTVVLASKALVLEKSVQVFEPLEKLEVLGDFSMVCFPLVGGQPLKDSKTMDEVLLTSSQGSKFKAVLTLDTGKQVVLDSQAQAWSMFGEVLKRDEVSACVSTIRKSELPVGSIVKRVEVSSDKPLRVEGIYWTSSSPPGGTRKQSSSSGTATEVSSST
jgi:hypothetical protein